MQPGSGGAGAGLHRYSSAPATWLEALLESDNKDIVTNPSPILHSPNKPPPVPAAGAATTSAQRKTVSGRFAADTAPFDSGCGGDNFVRQNSSPAEFLSHINSDGYFSSSFGYSYLSSPNLDVSQSAKRPRENDLDISPGKLSYQLKGEHSGQLRSAGGSMDTEMEKLMEDLVPCKLRAKRGCATHPRSIAERVRRTRISDRIRKLQELVPNMDKHSNTADMLEEAVEYVKFLQGQIQELREHQKNCTCSMKEPE